MFEVFVKFIIINGICFFGFVYVLFFPVFKGKWFQQDDQKHMQNSRQQCGRDKNMQPLMRLHRWELQKNSLQEIYANQHHPLPKSRRTFCLF